MRMCQDRLDRHVSLPPRLSLWCPGPSIYSSSSICTGFLRHLFPLQYVFFFHFLSLCISHDTISHLPNLPSKNCSVSRKHSVQCKNTFESENFLKEKNHYYIRYKWNLRILTSSTSFLTCNIPLPEVRIIFSSRGCEWLLLLFLLT